MTKRSYPEADPETIRQAASLIDAAERILVLTGAGISTDSGIPDYRGPDGVWTRNPEAERLSNIEFYLADPELRKRAWLARLDHPAWAADANPGHHAVARLMARPSGRLLVTQNVDGLHVESGIDPERVIEIHGSMRAARCTGCGWTAPMTEVLNRVRAGDPDPACHECGSILKSATVFFGEGLNSQDLDRAFEEAEQCDLVLAAGTTLQVYPIAGIVPAAVRNGASLIIVNGEPTAMDSLATVLVTGDISSSLAAMIGESRQPTPATQNRAE